MTSKFYGQFAVFFFLIVLGTSCKRELQDILCNGQPNVTMRVFATGLNNPRGLQIGPDGNLYVAEGGIGGTEVNTEGCAQPAAPLGPFKGSTTGGRISMVNATGARTTVNDQLPTSSSAGGDVNGASDVLFIGNTLYALVSGGGCSHSVPTGPNGIYKIGGSDKPALVADLSAFQAANPVAEPDEDDFQLDGTWYSMYKVGDYIYALDPNHGELVKATTNGKVSRVVDISARIGHIVPTALTYNDGNFYIGNLGLFPIVDSSANVYQVSPSGELQVWASGFTTIVGLAFDGRERLYVLELTEGAPFPTPAKGKLLRVSKSGERTVIATGLNFPTGLTVGNNGEVYVSINGAGPNAIGGGQILKIEVQDCHLPDGLNKK